MNVGTGRCLSVLDMAAALQAKLSGPDPQMVGKFRRGDIRHCYADISCTKQQLGFEAKVRFEDGIDDLVAWAKEQAPVDGLDQATAELEAQGLTI